MAAVHSWSERQKARLYATAAMGGFVAIMVPLGRPIVHEWASLWWPSTEGIVESVRVDDHVMSFPVTARVLYTVDGRNYRKDIAPSGVTTIKSRVEADRLASLFSAQTRHPVYYDPRDPAAAVFKRGPGLGAIVPLITLPIIGGALFWWGIGTLRTGRVDWYMSRATRAAPVKARSAA